jgi:hypothetical protein
MSSCLDCSRPASLGPNSSGTTDMPSSSDGAFTPASSAAVGRKSAKYQGRSLTAPALILPGHRAIIGMRMPPSYIVCLRPRRGPALWKKSPKPAGKIGPLSLVKNTIVCHRVSTLSAKP